MSKKTTAAAKPDQMLADAARISPQQIWQAGLGAFIKAQEEGDRAFNRLVQEGSDLQKRERAEHRAADDTLAPTSWQRLEEMFEDRVARALAAMDVPTHRDLQDLQQRVDELTRLVTALGSAARQAPVKKASVKKAPVKKAPVKKAAAQKAPVKKAAGKKAPATQAPANQAAASAAEKKSAAKKRA